MISIKIFNIQLVHLLRSFNYLVEYFGINISMEWSINSILFSFKCSFECWIQAFIFIFERSPKLPFGTLILWSFDPFQWLAKHISNDSFAFVEITIELTELGSINWKIVSCNDFFLEKNDSECERKRFMLNFDAKSAFKLDAIPLNQGIFCMNLKIHGEFEVT